MLSVNKVILLGRVGNDPEVKFMPSGNAVVNLSIATNRKFKNADGCGGYRELGIIGYIHYYVNLRYTWRRISMAWLCASASRVVSWQEYMGGAWYTLDVCSFL